MRGVMNYAAVRRVAAIGALAVLVAGCASAVKSTGESDAVPAGGSAAADYIGQAEQVQSVPAVAAACPALHAHPLPKNPPADQVFLCKPVTRRLPGEGEWLFAQVLRATSGVDRLLTAYARDDAARGGVCNAVGYDPLVVWLHTSPVTMVHAPQGRCGEPEQDAQAAYDALTTEIVTELRVRQLQSQTAIDSGCEQRWKDMLSIVAHDSTVAPSGIPAPLPAGSAKICRYAVRLDETGDRVGELTSGERLTADRLHAINTALAAATPDASCRRDDHHAFAVIEQDTYVALDGCAVQQGNTWWHAPDQLRALLE